MYNKKDKNFLMGKMHFEDKSMVDGQKFQEKKLDTTINGMEYKLIGTLDMAAKKLNVKLMGFQGRTHELDFKINTGAEYGFFVTGDVHGPVDIKMVVKKDMKKIDF